MKHNNITLAAKLFRLKKMMGTKDYYKNGCNNCYQPNANFHESNIFDKKLKIFEEIFGADAAEKLKAKIEEVHGNGKSSFERGNHRDSSHHDEHIDGCLSAESHDKNFIDERLKMFEEIFGADVVEKLKAKIEKMHGSGKNPFTQRDCRNFSHHHEHFSDDFSREARGKDFMDERLEMFEDVFGADVAKKLKAKIKEAHDNDNASFACDRNHFRGGFSKKDMGDDFFIGDYENYREFSDRLELFEEIFGQEAADKIKIKIAEKCSEGKNPFMCGNRNSRQKAMYDDKFLEFCLLDDFENINEFIL